MLCRRMELKPLAEAQYIVIFSARVYLQHYILPAFSTHYYSGPWQPTNNKAASRVAASKHNPQALRTQYRLSAVAPRKLSPQSRRVDRKLTKSSDSEPQANGFCLGQWLNDDQRHERIAGGWSEEATNSTTDCATEDSNYHGGSAS